MGLFDAALNYLWDETIQSLRDKVVKFDLDYFYDTAIKDAKNRAKFKDEEDLVRLEDWQLVSGCQETGIITELGYKHLDYIRDMRNHASAAHPNHNEITGIQLASWLEICIQEVIAKEPQGAVIEVRKLLKSLREEVLSKDDIPPIAEAIKKLPSDLVHSLLRNTFGMYTDTKIESKIRRNINLVAIQIWKASSEEIRYEIGLKYSSFQVNAEISRKERAYEFLQQVKGLPYLPEDTIALQLNEALDALSTAHYGWNNFHTEPAPAKLVQSFIPPSGEIPKSVIQNYVLILTICRIGNEYGVSIVARDIYDDLIDRWSNEESGYLIQALNRNSKLLSKLQFSSCQKQLQLLLLRLSSNITDTAIKEMIELIAKFPISKLSKIYQDRDFKQKLSGLNL